jgi:large subunit GTPase 1
MWADHFDGQNVRYAFFSAANATALQELRREMEATPEAAENEESAGIDSEEEGSDEEEDDNLSEEEDHHHSYLTTEEDSPDGRDPRTKVLSVLELEDLFFKTAPDLSSKTGLVSPHPLLTLSSFQGFLWKHGLQACSRVGRLSECRKVEHHQRTHWGEES